MEDAQGQWDSQAPFVFESLQVVDEARLDHLRGCLTQFQTFSSEVSTAVNSAAEESLNALLNWQTSVEIEHFYIESPDLDLDASRASQEPAAASPVGPDSDNSGSPAPGRRSPQPAVQRSTCVPSEDSLTSLLISVQERRQSRLSLRRFKTVLKGGRKEPSHPYGQPLSPDKRASATNLSKFTPFEKNPGKFPTPLPCRHNQPATCNGSESHHLHDCADIRGPPSHQPRCAALGTHSTRRRLCAVGGI